MCFGCKPHHGSEEQAPGNCNHHGHFISLESQEERREYRGSEDYTERRAHKENAEAHIAEEFGRHGPKEVWHLPGEEAGEQQAQEGGAHRDGKPGACTAGRAFYVASRLIFGYVLGDCGLHAKVEISDIGAQLQDENPCSVDGY